MINGRQNAVSQQREDSNVHTHAELKNEISFFMTIRFVENFVVSDFCVLFGFFFIQIDFFELFSSLFEIAFNAVHTFLPLCLFYGIEFVSSKRFYFQ